MGKIIHYFFGTAPVVTPALFAPTFGTVSLNTLGTTYASGPTYSAFARQYVDTTAPSIKATVFSTIRYNFNTPGSPSPLSENEAAIVVLLNGSFLTYLTPSQSGVAEEFTVSLPGTGLKHVCFVHASTSRANDAGDIEGTMLRQLSVSAPYTIAPVAPPRKSWRIATLTDSIGVGIGSDVAAREGVVPLLMQRYGSDVEIWTTESYGSKRAGLTATHIPALLSQLHTVFDGSTNQRLYIELGANDYFSGAYSPAQVAAALSSICDAARQEFPNLLITLANMLLTTAGDNSAYNAAVEGVRSGRLTFLDIADLRSQIPLNLLVDGVHPNNDGQVIMAGVLEKSALFGSTWKDTNLFILDSDVSLVNGRYQTSATDGLYGHRGLANQYNPAGGYLSFQFHYTGSTDQNAVLGFHTAPQRVGRAQMAFSVFVNSAGKLVIEAYDPGTGTKQVLSDTIPAIVGNYYVVNRNNTGNGAFSIITGANKFQTAGYSIVYNNPALYTSAALYAVTDFTGNAVAGLTELQLDASSLVAFSQEAPFGNGSTPPAGYTGAVAPYYIEDTETNPNYYTRTGPWTSTGNDPNPNPNLHGGSEIYLQNMQAGTITLRFWGRRFSLGGDTYNTSAKGRIPISINGLNVQPAQQPNQQQDNPNGAGLSWSYYTSPLTDWQEYTVVINIPATSTAVPAFDYLQALDS
jgi:lysophospholipase L1-like esterase